eukprot:5039775-Lingulodinium_polyedra.AAC.1
MGPAGAAFAQLCADEAALHPGLSACPAVTLADQEKAFERIGRAWLGEVLRRWRVPAWLLGAACALVCGRTGTARAEKGFGP